MYYRKGELWYEVIAMVWHEDTDPDKCVWNETSIYQFPVPITDCGDGQFNAEDKAIYFMRYIRKYMQETVEP